MYGGYVSYKYIVWIGWAYVLHFLDLEWHRVVGITRSEGGKLRFYVTSVFLKPTAVDFLFLK
jgi:hypothetical protein